MILLAALASPSSSPSCSPFRRPSSRNAWMVDDSRMAVIPPDQGSSWPSNWSQLETIKSRSPSSSSCSRSEIASSLDRTASPASPKRIRPRRKIILLASPAFPSSRPFRRPSSINAWMVDDSRMAVIPPKQCLISSQGNRRPAMTAADVHNSLISAVTAAGSTRSFRTRKCTIVTRLELDVDQPGLWTFHANHLVGLGGDGGKVGVHHPHRLTVDQPELVQPVGRIFLQERTRQGIEQLGHLAPRGSRGLHQDPQ